MVLSSPIATPRLPATAAMRCFRRSPRLSRLYVLFMLPLRNNHGSKITMAEFAADWHTVSASVFSKEDLDADGALTWEEFQGPKGASLEEAVATTETRRQSAAPLNLFAALDADIDGRISKVWRRASCFCGDEIAGVRLPPLQQSQIPNGPMHSLHGRCC